MKKTFILFLFLLSIVYVAEAFQNSYVLEGRWGLYKSKTVYTKSNHIGFYLECNGSPYLGIYSKSKISIYSGSSESSKTLSKSISCKAPYDPDFYYFTKEFYAEYISYVHKVKLEASSEMVYYGETPYYTRATVILYW